MPDPGPDNEQDKPPTELPDGFAADLPDSMNLETIIDLTGELEHLNELVLLSLDKSGGFTTTEAYFETVQPILDLLVVEIRVRYRKGMSRNQLKLIIQDWIDEEIRELQ